MPAGETHGHAQGAKSVLAEVGWHHDGVTLGSPVARGDHRRTKYLAVLEDTEGQGQIALGDTYTHTRRYLGLLQIDILQGHFDSLALEERLDSESVFICVYGDSYQAHRR